ncbi:MAG: CdaR family protein [Planctomycetota bacterium]
MSKIIALLLKDKWLKLISVALATATWIYVSEQRDKAKEVSVPLRLTVPDDKFLLDPRRPQMLRVLLRGPERAIAQFREESLSAEIRITEKVKRLPDTSRAPQPVTIQIGPDDIQNVPDTIAVKSVQPDRISVVIDEMTRKRLQVTVDREKDLKGELKEGYRIHRISPVPNKVMVRGPRSILKERQSIHPLQHDISGLGPQNWKARSRLDTGDAKTGLRDCLSPEEPKVIIWFYFIQLKTDRVFENVPVFVHGPPGFTYTVLRDQTRKPLEAIPEVTLSGPEDLFEEADVAVRAIVDLTDVDPAKTPEIQRTVRYTVGAKDPETRAKVKREIAEQIELPPGPEVIVKAKPAAVEPPE